jgi:hypothetical protein
MQAFLLLVLVLSTHKEHERDMIEAGQIPEGHRGAWAVERFTVSKQDSEFDRIRAIFGGGRYVPPGTYTGLKHRQRGIVMSDTPDERRDHFEAVYRAKGHVLLNGLGIGMVLAAILKKNEVERVTVVEIDPDVIALVGPHYKDPRVAIFCANAYDYQPIKGERYGAVWHDIWDNICGDNLSGMTKLKRKYGRRTDWQGCWCEYQCRRGR